VLGRRSRVGQVVGQASRLAFEMVSESQRWTPPGPSRFPSAASLRSRPIVEMTGWKPVPRRAPRTVLGGRSHPAETIEESPMTLDEGAEAKEEAITMALMPLSDRRQRLLAVALVRSMSRLASGEVVASAIEVAERFADTGKTKAAMKRAREALADARVAL